MLDYSFFVEIFILKLTLHRAMIIWVQDPAAVVVVVVEVTPWGLLPLPRALLHLRTL